MSSLHSFYLSPEKWTAPYTLDPTEFHHMARVLRIKKGQNIRLFDGQGRHGIFSVSAVSKNAAELKLEEEFFAAKASSGYTLAAGFSKALRRGWFMEKTVELEAAAVWFWQGDYSQAALPEEEKESWRASLITGAKQCEAAWLPALSMLKGGVETLISQGKLFKHVFLLYEGDTDGRLLEREDLAADENILLIVGPEGGYSPRELNLLKDSDIVPVSLGNRILRWETAALLTLGMAWWARQKP